MEEGKELVMEMVPYENENENEIFSSMEEGKELEMEMVPYYILTESFYRKLTELLDPLGFNLMLVSSLLFLIFIFCHFFRLHVLFWLLKVFMHAFKCLFLVYWFLHVL